MQVAAGPVFVLGAQQQVAVHAGERRRRALLVAARANVEEVAQVAVRGAQRGENRRVPLAPVRARRVRRGLHHLVERQVRDAGLADFLAIAAAHAQIEQRAAVVAEGASPACIASPTCVSICGSRILDSLKIGQTVLHSPQFTQWSARAETSCGVGALAAAGAACVGARRRGSRRSAPGSGPGQRRQRGARNTPHRAQPRRAQGRCAPEKRRAHNVAVNNAPSAPCSRSPTRTPRFRSARGSSARFRVTNCFAPSAPNLRARYGACQRPST